VPFKSLLDPLDAFLKTFKNNLAELQRLSYCLFCWHMGRDQSMSLGQFE